MWRLTVQDTYGHWIVPLYDENGKIQYPQQVINKLAQYENSGYEPEELEELTTNNFNKTIKGVWLINPDGYYPYCSRCKSEPQGKEMTKFCPNCGADMKPNKE